MSETRLSSFNWIVVMLSILGTFCLQHDQTNKDNAIIMIIIWLVIFMATMLALALNIVNLIYPKNFQEEEEREEKTNKKDPLEKLRQQQ